MVLKIISILILILFSIGMIYYYLPDKPIPPGLTIDLIIVNKSKRELLVFSNGKEIKAYPISLGDNPVGAKEKKDDEKTPEGQYFINSKADVGQSKFYRNLGISYPQNKDKINAEKHRYNPGGDIKIHGLKNGLGFIGKFHRWKDWTDGCIAVSNEEMDDLFNHISVGTPIIIKP